MNRLRILYTQQRVILKFYNAMVPQPWTEAYSPPPLYFNFNYTDWLSLSLSVFMILSSSKIKSEGEEITNLECS